MDAFAELGLPRSPAVEEAILAHQFDELSRVHHPDAGGQPETFARLNEARRLLSSPALRLRHLLELEHPGTRIDGDLNPALLDLFTSLGPSLQAARDLERRKSAATSSLARALLAAEEWRVRESLEHGAAALAEKLEHLGEATRNWDGSAPSLAGWAREAAFLEKWQSQVRDHLSRLGF